MPSLPKYKRKRYLPKPKQRQGSSNQEFYNSTAWRKARAVYFKENPLCEFNNSLGRIVEGKVVDHIIPITKGGAEFDERNFMTLHSDVHDRKSALEKHRGCLVDAIWKDGEKVPVNRNDIFEILK